MDCEFEHKIFTAGEKGFTALALETFHFQYRHNAVYKAFVDAIHTDIAAIQLVEQIPFLPISFFKSQTVTVGDFVPEVIFESSGTTTSINSRHQVKKLAIYLESFKKGFEREYGRVEDFCILGLLPSYLERQHSSLVMMVDQLIKDSKHPQSGFYLYEHEKLADTLKEQEAKQQPTLLIGVTFGLLDFAENFHIPLKHTLIMETGGMKGRREELTRFQVHEILKASFGVDKIHSEYGMTELLSQAYSKGDGLFECPPWMKILVREEDDPFSVSSQSSSRGVINVIDLANIYSCSFIATDDAGRLHDNGMFEVLGRVDNSDVRGCSLMAV